MDFIRRQRSNPGHDANTHHVIYGLVSVHVQFGYIHLVLMYLRMLI